MKAVHAATGACHKKYNNEWEPFFPLSREQMGRYLLRNEGLFVGSSSALNASSESSPARSKC